MREQRSQQSSHRHFGSPAQRLSTGSTRTKAGKSARALKLDLLILAAPLAVSLYDIAAGSYAAALTVAYFAIGRVVKRKQVDAFDLLVGSIFLIVLASPMWLEARSEVPSAFSSARGAAIGVLYVLPVRWTIVNYGSFIGFIRLLSWICTAYALLVLLTGVSVAVAGATGYRLFVEFANPNFIGAVVASGAITSLWLAADKLSPLHIRWIYVGAFALQVLTVYESGSRSSMAGILIAAIALVSFRRAPRVARGLVFVLMIVGFSVGFYPSAASGIFRILAEPLAGFSTFSRDRSALQTSSGRLEIWASTKEIIQESWLVGWGPGRYLYQGDSSGILAHNWGLEFMASVGLVGTFLLVLLTVMCFFGRRPAMVRPPEKRAAFDGRAALWNAVTALALIPNLVLSTHQWTLWAWAVISLWSRAYLLSGQGEAELAVPNTLTSGSIRRASGSSATFRK